MGLYGEAVLHDVWPVRGRVIIISRLISTQPLSIFSHYSLIQSEDLPGFLSFLDPLPKAVFRNDVFSRSVKSVEVFSRKWLHRRSEVHTESPFLR